MKIIAVLLSVVLVTVLGGCVLGSIQTMSGVNIRCTVLDEESGRPIEGARVEIAFAPANPNSKRIPNIVFVTDSSGVCQIDIPKRSRWISGSDAFVGGYLRRIIVVAPCYEDSGVSEGFQKRLFGELREKTFRLHRKRADAARKEPNHALEPAKVAAHLERSTK